MDIISNTVWQLAFFITLFFVFIVVIFMSIVVNKVVVTVADEIPILNNELYNRNIENLLYSRNVFNERTYYININLSEMGIINIENYLLINEYEGFLTCSLERNYKNVNINKFPITFISDEFYCNEVFSQNTTLKNSLKSIRKEININPKIDLNFLYENRYTKYNLILNTFVKN